MNIVLEKKKEEMVDTCSCSLVISFNQPMIYYENTAFILTVVKIIVNGKDGSLVFPHLLNKDFTFSYKVA